MTSVRSHFKFVAAAIVCVSTLLVLWTQFGSQRNLETQVSLTSLTNGNDAATDILPCAMLPGANDTLVVVKTGATELQDKLPIHLNTTIRCYPNYMIYSDLAETFEGNAIFDALADVNDNIKLEHHDFELYRKLQQHSGRAVLTQAELSGAAVSVHSVSGNTENPGWKLDKWKFLPMMERTLQEHPDKRWYVFLETDTFVFWETLLAYLAVLDPAKPYYMGSPALIGDEEFAHGGSGYLVSQPALEAVVRQYTENQNEWETVTDGHWAGDCVLGKAFKAAGISLTRAWPIWQGDHIGDMNYGHTDSSDSQWCHPTVSYHHLGASAIEDLWNFEREWASSSKHEAQPYLRHRDVFTKYIIPRASFQTPNWNNHAERDRGFVNSPKACRLLCEDDAACAQWVVESGPDRRCLTTSRPNMGEPSDDKTSGWFAERIQAFRDAQTSCEDDEWIL